MKIFTEMFITFFKIGCLAFGGGLAVIAILQKEVVNTRLRDRHTDTNKIPAICVCGFR